VARGDGPSPAVAPEALRAVAERLADDDVPIMRMLVAGTPPEEVATVLGISPRWLDVRRWAILEQLRSRP
jgi:FixJ family two-component response regulator